MELNFLGSFKKKDKKCKKTKKIQKKRILLLINVYMSPEKMTLVIFH